MNYLIVIVFLFCVFYLFYVCYICYKKNINIENFGNTYTKEIILLGDSILNNSEYVSYGNSIAELLQLQSNKNILCYALDDCTIDYTYNQIERIPLTYNKSSTAIFLSIGGNDILEYYMYKKENTNNTKSLKEIFLKYKNLLKTIQKTFSKTKIILLDIYYPKNIKYEPFFSIISKWNKMMYSYIHSLNNKNVKILQISKILIDLSDFSFEIEPSSIGGEKLVTNILQIANT